MNEHIKDYLKYYIELDYSPEFAILIRGKWGSGKTFFINEFIRQNKTTKFLKVSLFGLTKSSSIDDAIFEQLHPLLAHKGTKLASSILKGFLKATIKLDLNGDGKEEGSITPSLPNIDLPAFLKDADSHVLIFDDLERCSINITDLLGYINNLVEAKGLKVIIVGNEVEIDQDGDNNLGKKGYLTIKEKLIGRSFEIEPDAIGAMESFKLNIKNSHLIDFLYNNPDLLLSVYQQAGYNNLRHLRQTIVDLDRFFDLLDDNVFEKKDLINHIVELFACMAFELKNGTLKEDQITELFAFDFLSASDQKNQTSKNSIKGKYQIFTNYNYPFASEYWVTFFKTGTVDKVNLSNSIEGSRYFLSETTPKWRWLWMYYDLEDEHFYNVYKQVLNKLSEGSIDDKWELAQTVSTLIHLSEHHLIKLTKPVILKLGMKNIDRLADEGKLKKDMKTWHKYPSDSCYGLAYHSAKLEEFISFSKYAAVKETLVFNKSLKVKSIGLFNEMRTNPESFINKIAYLPYSAQTGEYINIPILKYINPKKFISRWLSLEPNIQSQISNAINSRYSYFSKADDMAEELPWLHEVIKLIESAAIKRKNKVSGMRLTNSILPELKSAVHLLSNTIK